MNNRLIIMLFFSLFIIFITACDSDNVEIDTQQEDSKISNEMTTESSDFDHAEEEQATEDAENIPDGTSDQMVIHQAYLTVQVKDLEKTQLQIDKKVSEYDGYTVESNVYQDRKSTRLNSSHVAISYAVFCLKKKIKNPNTKTAKSE